MHGMQERVAVGAVDRCRKFGMQRHGLADSIEREIWSVCLAFHFEFREFAGIFSVGGKDSRDPRKGTEVGVGEFVTPVYGRRAWIIDVPRTEIASRVDFSFRLGIGQRSMKVERLVEAYGSQREIVED